MAAGLIRRSHVHERPPAALPGQALLPVRGGQDPDVERLPDELLGLCQLRSADQHAQAYAEFLGRVPWQQFWTLTFRPSHTSRSGGVHEEKADKAFRYFVSCINREVYGRAWAKRPHGGIQWARGQEFHKDGRIHFHALAAAPTDDLSRITNRRQWKEFWFQEFGLARLEIPRSQSDINGYVSKYVSKGGTVDLSRNFGAWTPPKIDYTARPEQHGLIQPTSNTG